MFFIPFSRMPRTQKRRRVTQTTRRKRLSQRGGQQQNLNIRYGATKVMGQSLTQQETQQKPFLMIPENHYVVLSDPDATQPDYIHWIASSTKEILPYQGPSPPPGTGTHRYIFTLAKGQPPSAPASRSGQTTSRFITKPVATAFFTVSS